MNLFPLYDWSASVWIGWWVVSYWRSTWTLFDIWLCDQPPDASLARGDSFCLLVPAASDPEIAEVRLQSARISYGIGIGCLAVGVFIIWWGAWVPRNEQQKVTPCVATVRFLAVYILGLSAVNLWRGIWYWADAWILPANPYQSFWTTSIAGSTLCFLLCAGNSLLAPPAIFLLDGPGIASPPIAVTLLSSHYAITLPAGANLPKLSLPVKIVDVVLSFIVLPFGVVFYWRGSWQLLDYWFWGLTEFDSDVNISLLWSFILAVSICILTSEPAVGFVDKSIENHWVISLLGRFRTYLLAWGCVSWWRLVWLVWDQFMGGSTTLSAGLGHVISIILLTITGCVSSICAPASTMGVDSVPNEDAADEPLFSVLPLPYELLYVMGISRQPEAKESSPLHVESDSEIEMMQQESDRSAIIDKEKKKLPARLSDAMEPVDETQPVEVPLPKQSEGQIQQQLGEDEMELNDAAPAMEVTSSRRGWQANGNFRSYTELQRSGAPTTRSEYAQRPGMGNRRSRSKFFRSR